MSAARLREAATQIRLEWDGERGGGWHLTQTFHLAVADWLDRVAEDCQALDLDFPHEMPHRPDPEALAVANAYLGGAA